MSKTLTTFVILIGSIIAKLPVLNPNKMISNLKISHNEEKLFEVLKNDLNANQFYKVMVHYDGSVRNQNKNINNF